MRTKNAVKNIFFSFVNKFIGIILTFFITPFIFKHLGDELYGTNALLLQTVGYLGLIELGIGGSIVLALYRTLAENDYTASNAIVAAAYTIFRYMGIALLVIGAVVAYFLPAWFKLNNDIAFMAQAAFYIYVIKASIQYFYSLPLTVLSVAQKEYKISWVQAIAQPSTMLVNILVVYLGYSIVGMAIASLLIGIATYIIQLMIAKKELPWINVNFTDKNYKAFGTTKYIFIDKILVLGVFQTDYILISIYMGPQYVGIYAIYTTFFSITRDVVWLFFNNLSYGIGEMYAKDLQEDILALWKDVNTFAFSIVILTTPLFYFLFPYFINLWIGKEKILTDAILILFIANFNYLIIVHCSTIFINAKNYFKQRLFGSISELAVNIICSIILIPRIGVLGAILGTALGHYLTNFWFIPKLFMHSVQQSLLFYFRFIFKYFIFIFMGIAIQYGLFNYWLKKVLDLHENWLTFIVVSLLMGAIALAYTFLILQLFDKNFKNLKLRLSGLVPLYIKKTIM